ncbi:MAG: class I tRNA ligase family protein, partial [Bacteroidia bacterium]
MRLFLQTLKIRFRQMSKEYKHSEIESKWQQYWNENQTYKVTEDASKPKFYVLDMFPYPSGAGLHVGHPLGYIASDIYSRYKKLKGFNVLHPMGYDAFGLPAEQYAIQTGQHPAITTKENIARYREQLDKIGFCYDWSRQVKTSDPEYYKWTQWIFLKLFHSWYNPTTNRAESIDLLVKRFEEEGCKGSQDQTLTGGIETEIPAFTANDWKAFNEKQKADILMNFRLAYLAESYVNWCPALGTVLANDEVKEGVSERGGYPVERKLMMQWSLRITAYSDRLLQGLDDLDWTESLKEAQRNWIGKSTGASVFFPVKNSDKKIEVFTTRPDTLFGVSYVTLAPEHEWVSELTTNENKSAVEEYVSYAKNRSERERMADVKKVSGQFTGSYAIHPFTGQEVPIWIGDYVLAGYGTGAVMAVPAHDSRDFAFAKHFNLPIIQVIETPANFDLNEASWDEKSGKLIHSEFLNGLEVKAAIQACIKHLEEIGAGKGKTNFRLRDAIFGRQRYWGEPIPIYYKDGIAHPLSEDELPLLLPEVDKYLPTETGEPPLGRAKNWKYKGEYDYELSTMPGWAGSSWYFLRYMDPNNQTQFAAESSLNYWQQVDLYLGGSEHATGHLLYVRF